MSSPSPTRMLAAAGVAAVGSLALAGPASAHVTITPDTTAAGAYALLTVSVPHGCEGSATTKVAIKMPEEITSVTPTRNPFYTVTKKMQKLATPIKDAHGNEVTERVDQVVYTARTPLPDGQRDAFELSLQLPDKSGETLAFPTIQTCQKGSTPWTEVATSGQDPESLEHPAPSVTVTAAEEGDAHGAVMKPEKEESESDGSDSIGVIGVVLGALGVIVGGLALARSRRTA